MAGSSIGSSRTPTPSLSGSGGDVVLQSHLPLSEEGIRSGSAKPISVLTPYQLRKKREIDRKAQRNRRARTRAQIETLEQQLDEIGSKSFYKDLERSKIETKALERENTRIKTRLSGMKSEIEELLNDQDSGTTAPNPNSERSKHYAPYASPLKSHPIRINTPETVFSTSFTQPCHIYGKSDRQDSGRALLRVDDCVSLDIRVHRALVDQPAHARPIHNLPAETPIDRLLLDFIAERQQLVASGMSKRDLVGPEYPSFEALLESHEKSTNDSDLHPLSKILTDILRTFSNLSTVPEKVATLYIMFMLMRWQIDPTLENYDRLPTWFTPRPSQLFESHPAWIDQLPFPRLRDYLVREHLSYSFEDFALHYTTSLSVSWPYEPMDALLRVDGDQLLINPVFERYIRNGANRKVGLGFIKAYPCLADVVKGEIIRPMNTYSN